ncbi:MAG: gamma-glutamyl-gamma-aminobutyrate hydrolase family protein [Rubrivivax sp.]|jgi:putative glutamine amidotransferase
MSPTLSKTAERPPVVLVTSCNRTLGKHPFHIAGRKYLDFVRLAGAMPLIAPPFSEAELPALLALADGVLLTGSPSNVHPSNFGEDVHNPELPLDPERDGWTLPLIRLALAQGVPVFGICRGTQETNVALGGSLHQAVQEQAGLNDHRGPDHVLQLPGEQRTAEQEYAQAHPVDVVPGGLLERITRRNSFEVNSVHGQGVKRLAAGLRVEAVAPDGLVEAFSVADAPGFSLCVQWHPEWQAAGNPVSVQLADAFGVAVRAYRDKVRGPLPAAAVQG